MDANGTPEPHALLLGVGVYVALVGWLMILPPAAFMLLMFTGAQPPFEMPADSIGRHIVRLTAFAIAGYVTGRASDDVPVFNAAWLGGVLYLLGTLFERGLMWTFDADVAFDPTAEIFALVQIVVAIVVGGTAALWQTRTRGAKRFRFSDLSQRGRFAVLAIAIAPFVLLALSYRP